MIAAQVLFKLCITDPISYFLLKCMYFLQAVLIGSKRRYVRTWAPWESGKYEKYEIFQYCIFWSCGKLYKFFLLTNLTANEI